MIDKIVIYLNSKKNMVNSIKLDSVYMCPGEYVFDKHLNYLIKNDVYSKNRKRIEEILNIKDIKSFFKKVFVFVMRKLLFRQSTSILSRSNLHGFTGSVYIPVRSTSGYGDRRIFDIKNNKVLTIFTEKKDYEAVLQTYCNFKEHFSMPTILWTDDERNLIIEELISFHPTCLWSEIDYANVFNTIGESYRQYFQTCKKNRAYSIFTPNDLVLALSEYEELYFIQKKISKEFLQQKFPCVIMHGDLWTSNTLLEKSGDFQIKLIDWEYSKELLFFYDFFTLMWLEYYMNNNQFYFDKYVKGEYDNYFVEIFSIFDTFFQSAHRLEYFHLFFLFFYKERLIKLNSKIRTAILNKYKLLIKEKDLQ